MLFALPSMSFLCPVLVLSSCSVLFALLIFFFLCLFSKEKVAKKHRNLLLVDSRPPPSTPKVGLSSPICFPPTLPSVLALMSPFLIFNVASKIWTHLLTPKRVSHFHPPQGHPSSSYLPPINLVLFPPCPAMSNNLFTIFLSFLP